MVTGLPATMCGYTVLSIGLAFSVYAVAGSVPVMVTFEMAQVSLDALEVSPNDVQRKASGRLSLGSARVCRTGMPVASFPTGPAMETSWLKSPVAPGTVAWLTLTESPDVVASGLKSE